MYIRLIEFLEAAVESNLVVDSVIAQNTAQEQVFHLSANFCYPLIF